MNEQDLNAANLTHAVATWLQRAGISDSETVVVIGVSPKITIGAWAPGLTNVVQVPTIDPPAREVLESVPSVVNRILDGLSADPAARTCSGTGPRRTDATDCFARGSRRSALA